MAQVLGDVAVGSNAARGNLGDDGRHPLEERSLFVGLNGHGDNPASLTEYSEGYRKNRGRPAGAFSIQPSQLHNFRTLRVCFGGRSVACDFVDLAQSGNYSVVTLPAQPGDYSVTVFPAQKPPALAR